MYIEKNPFVTLREYEGDLFLLNDNNAYYLEGITPFLWEVMEEETIESLSLKVTKEYDVSLKKAERDVKKVVEFLEKENLVTLA
ncbi:PqqD family protein [Staphylococcus kloosii]|uniref:PqqD family protein n=1 Tax=Staphylococcus kloosii TaxID=29384 RepID=UPI0028A43B8A|nr:PqqD family protein [Staphylococcus kloosii]MDT3959788.1 PqqD family protein [Staphylococcus kloosii]